MTAPQYYEDLLWKLIRNRIDLFEVLNEGEKFRIDFSSASDFSTKKYLLQKAIILELIKVTNGPEKRRHEVMLVSTEKMLKLRYSKHSRGYLCTFLGCLFRGQRHRSYVNHCQTVHPTSRNFRCMFKHLCQRSFPSINDLREHVKTAHYSMGEHSDKISAGVEVILNPCKCSMLSCGEKLLDSTKALATHMNTFHVGEPRICIFRNCEVKFKANSVSRNHYRLKHFKSDQTELKNVHLCHATGSDKRVEEHVIEEADNLVNVILPSDMVNEDMENEDGMENEDDRSDDSTANQDENKEDNESFFTMAYADFLNRLINKKFIPVTSVREIAAEYLNQSHQSADAREKVLRNSLNKIPNITKDQIDEIVRENQEDPFVRAQEELSTPSKLTKFLEKNFKLVKPVEIILNKEDVKNGAPKEVAHYVPILEAFKVLVEDASFNNALEMERNEVRVEDEIIKDVKDGKAFKTSKYFSENPEAFALMLYSDAVELTNPLASGKGKHKIVQLFWQVCDVPRYQRSSVDRLQLGLVFKEKLLKKHSYSKIFQCLVNDLMVLEKDGIEVQEPVERRVKAGVLLYCGDNLESHLVGGFSASFSSKDVCRHCHIQYSDLQTNIHDFSGDSVHKQWSEAEYDSHEVEVEDDVSDNLSIEVSDDNLFNEFDEPNEVDATSDEDRPEEIYENESNDEDGNDDEMQRGVNFGIKRKCVFNKLESFHCVGSMPPDSLHDLMEGVVPQDLLGIIRIMMSKNWFTLENYNRALSNVKLSSQELSNKPQLVPSSSKVKKLAGKAVSNWVHIRLFPFILFVNGWIDDSDDVVLLLAIKLNELTERITAETFRPHELDTLEDLIVEYLDLRKEIFEEFPVLGRAKPKHHYLVHYPAYIDKFGPTSGFWTGRFESKHRVAKSTSQASKNFINISSTVSHRQQYRMCSSYYSGMFSSHKYLLPMKVKVRDDLKDSELELVLKQIMSSQDDLVCSEIELWCRKYKVNDVVVIRRSDQITMSVALIKSIVVKKQTIFAVVRKYEVVQNYLRLFESTSMSTDLHLINLETLQDSYPLFRRGTEKKFILIPHHHISFSYD